MYIKKSSDGKIEMRKVYAALYTCATTREVHLEMTPSMEASSFLRSLTRFVSRRGVPRLIVSNNFKSFVTVSGKIQAQPGASEVVFSRLVRSTKRCLKKQLGNAKLTYEELMAVLCEVEVILNSRPIQKMSKNLRHHCY